MRNGNCPSCGMSAVYASRNGIQHQQGVYIYNLGGTTTPASDYQSYVCTNCGYIENHIVDRAKLKEIEKNWQKVGNFKQV